MASSASHQHTLAGPAIFAGVGVHSGQHVRVCIRPAPAGVGVTFIRTDIDDRDNRIPAMAEAVVQTRLGTVIGNAAGVTVSTVEHLMAALAALGVDNAIIELDGPEVPIMDGSAEPFVEILDRTGLRRQEAARRYIEILQTVEVEEEGKRAALSPADRFEMAFEVEFESKAIGRQRVDVALDEALFRNEFADCRTFGFAREVDALRAAGLARGGSLENVVVIEGHDIVNPEGLRRPDEMVRHKALDALGDLYLLGAPLIGRFEGLYSGHEINNALVRALLKRPECWRLRTLGETYAEAV
ncbi:MAG: UDP-3-O-acyl-N-acetylglucosamine deacetylase [Caulobacteraceae bacterium]|nr:UDP-3-O-acyl-N-acetylglucosamine deacetylase [Caulobacteraceae bacterium]